MRRDETVAHYPGLDERHRAAARADAKGMWLCHDLLLRHPIGEAKKSNSGPPSPTATMAFSLRVLRDAATLADDQ